MHTRHIHSFVHQRDATDNGLIHLSYVKASAALDFFDNVYPLLISEERPSLYSPVPLPEPLRATLPLNSTLSSFASLTSRRRPELYWKKKKHITWTCVKSEFPTIGGNTVVWHMKHTCLRACTCPDIFYLTMPFFWYCASFFFSFKCNPMPFFNAIQVKTVWFVFMEHMDHRDA